MEGQLCARLSIPSQSSKVQDSSMSNRYKSMFLYLQEKARALADGKGYPLETMAKQCRFVMEQTGLIIGPVQKIVLKASGRVLSLQRISESPPRALLVYSCNDRYRRPIHRIHVYQPPSNQLQRSSFAGFHYRHNKFDVLSSRLSHSDDPEF